MVFSMDFERVFGDLWKYIWGFMVSFLWILKGCWMVFGDELEEFKVTW